MSEATRAYLYRIALALLALAGVFKLIGPEDTPVYVEVVSAVLGIGAAGLATAHTSRSPEA
jgi:hypothetical protein